MRSGLRVLRIEPSNIKLVLGILSGGQYSYYLGNMLVLSVSLFGCVVTLASGEAMVTCMFVSLK